LLTLTLHVIAPTTLAMTDDIRVKEGNIFVAAAASGLIGFIAPTDQEFIIVNADADRFPHPAWQESYLCLLPSGSRSDALKRAQLDHLCTHPTGWRV
jgi:hypothetical protein